MNSKFLTTLMVGTLLTTSFGLLGSHDEATKFFEFASKGSYVDMINQAKTGLINSDDLYLERDADGNTLIAAAIAGYPDAEKLYGDRKAAEYLNTIIDQLLTKLPKEEAAEELLNLQNTSGMTALRYAAKNGLMRTATVLHGRGALPIIGGKKASNDTTKKGLIVILQGWEKYQTENVETTAEKFANAGEAMKGAFTGVNQDETLAQKIARLKSGPR